MDSQASAPRAVRRGFTLVELLIVIGIIILLISILVPVVSRVRIAGYNASATAFVNQIARAVEAYEQDFKQFPGPLTNVEVCNTTLPPASLLASIGVDPAATEYDTNLDKTKITMPENLVLGLLGGLRYDTTPTSKLFYDPRLIGNGPNSLNTSGATKRYKPYIEAANLSWRTTETPLVPPDTVGGVKTGRYRDASGSADDTIIPEFLDPYPDQMPILYLRAKRGAVATVATVDGTNNTVVTYDPDPNKRVGQYDLHQITAYTNSSIGTGRQKITPAGWASPAPTHGLSVPGSGSIDVGSTLQAYEAPGPVGTQKYPYDAYPYFRNQALSSPKESDGTGYPTKTNRNDVPHQKDGFILISAGADRIYGTRDDITNFGSIGQ